MSIVEHSWSDAGQTAYIKCENTIAVSVTGSSFALNFPTIQGKCAGSLVEASVKKDCGAIYVYYGSSVIDAIGSGETSSKSAKGTYVNLPSIPAKTISTSSYFNASNKTTRSIQFITKIVSGATTFGYYGDSGGHITSNKTENVTTFTATLNAPPTCSYTQVQSDTGDKFFKDKTEAYVDISSLSAKYGGDITECKLTIGSQTATRTTNGRLSIKLNATGTFTPTVSLKDSRGQTTSYNLNPITVKNVPIYAKVGNVWKLAMPKVKASGTWKDAKSIYVKQGNTWKQIM